MEKYIRINEHVMVTKLNIMSLGYAKIYMFEKDSERSCLLTPTKNVGIGYITSCYSFRTCKDSWMRKPMVSQ